MPLFSLIEKCKALIFDFDGTLVDSNAIKRGAFEKCFADEPQHFQEILAYCRGNNHIPRKTKFRHVYEKILKRPYTAGVETRLLNLYAEHTTQQVISAREISGARDFLERFAFQKKTALLSSTPHEILLEILERREMRHCFQIIQGAPVEKAPWIQKFLKQHGLKNSEAVFIGDSAEDVAAAQTADIFFIGVGEADRAQTKYYIKDFRQI